MEFGLISKGFIGVKFTVWGRYMIRYGRYTGSSGAYALGCGMGYLRYYREKLQGFMCVVPPTIRGVSSGCFNYINGGLIQETAYHWVGIFSHTLKHGYLNIVGGYRRNVV